MQGSGRGRPHASNTTPPSQCRQYRPPPAASYPPTPTAAGRRTAAAAATPAAASPHTPLSKPPLVALGGGRHGRRAAGQRGGGRHSSSPPLYRDARGARAKASACGAGARRCGRHMARCAAAGGGKGGGMPRAPQSHDARCAQAAGGDRRRRGRRHRGCRAAAATGSAAAATGSAAAAEPAAAVGTAASATSCSHGQGAAPHRSQKGRGGEEMRNGRVAASRRGGAAQAHGKRGRGGLRETGEREVWGRGDEREPRRHEGVSPSVTFTLRVICRAAHGWPIVHGQFSRLPSLRLFHPDEPLVKYDVHVNKSTKRSNG